MTHSKPNIVDDAAAWQRMNERFPGTTREALDRIELGDRVARALDDTLNGGHP
ncbi:hypothetical protein AB0F88_39705 [Streptosporangium sp. NPDC023963]|uniref:hypothetical protein n=1 Tax=Streptosporangium sp. NPDC023963 TaxID=3155608 RepID=UPI00341BD811